MILLNIVISLKGSTKVCPPSINGTNVSTESSKDFKDISFVNGVNDSTQQNLSEFITASSVEVTENKETDVIDDRY